MKNLKKLGLVVSGLIASSQAFAVDHTAAITLAETDAITNVTGAATAVIAVVAVMFGIKLVVGVLRN